ncbi:hypothetical protein [Selenomonas ruminantium]|uniref:hypothetical protein n=1 Tax=Selenomonas ruminantium TaxID=971 RepID=UPI00117A8444|nr:hypothetical protein [Selenomonas ruminantium]
MIGKKYHNWQKLPGKCCELVKNTEIIIASRDLLMDKYYFLTSLWVAGRAFAKKLPSFHESWHAVCIYIRQLATL